MKPTHRRLVLSGSIATLFMFVAEAPAANWTGAVSNDWNTPGNWDGNVVPSGQNAYIGIAGSVTGPFTATITADVPAPMDLQVARTGGPGVLNHIAGSASTGSGNWIDVGTDGGIGTYNLANTNATGGTLTGFGTGSGSVHGYRLYVGGVDFGGGGGNGVMNVNTTGTLSTDNDFLIGINNAVGVFNLDAGTVNTGTGGGWNFIGSAKSNPGGHGVLNISGGTINAVGNGRTYVGDGNAWGEIHMTGGTYNNNINGAADNFTVGSGNLANANTSSVSMSGGIINAANFFVGGNDDGGGKGLVTISGTTATLNAGGQVWVGDNTGANGRMDISGGTVNAGNWFAVGRAGGTGVVNMSGGSLIKGGSNGNHLIIGSLAGNGTFNQTGGSVNTVGHGEIRMGENASIALWDLSGGTVQTDGTRVGWSGGTNELRIRGTGSFTTGFLDVGEAANNGSGVVNQTGGTVTSNSWIAVGLGSSVQAQYNLSGGTVNAAGFEAGADSAGLVTMSGNAVMTLSGNMEVPTRNGSGTLNISGGTLNAASFLQGGRDGQVGTGVTTQSGGLVKISGDLIVQRPNVGTGSYTLNSGTLSVDGNINLTLGTFNFNGGKITRSTPGIINVVGSLLTGTSNATLKLDADKTFAISGDFIDNSGMTLDISGQGIPDEPASPSPITGSLPLGTVGGNATPTGDAFDIAFAKITGFDPVFHVAGLGDFTAIRINQGDAFNATTQSVYWVDKTGTNVTVQYSVVPEPATLGLFSLAGLGLAARRRRRE